MSSHFFHWPRYPVFLSYITYLLQRDERELLHGYTGERGSWIGRAPTFGMKVTGDDGKTQCRLVFGDNIVIARNASSRPGGKVGVDHIAYTLANWDTDKAVKPAVEAELKRRGLMIRTTEGSFHVQDPDGFEVQMGGKTQ